MKNSEVSHIKELAQLLIDQSGPGTDQYNDQLVDCIMQVDKRVNQIRVIHQQIKNIEKILNSYQKKETV